MLLFYVVAPGSVPRAVVVIACRRSECSVMFLLDYFAIVLVWFLWGGVQSCLGLCYIALVRLTDLCDGLCEVIR